VDDERANEPTTDQSAEALRPQLRLHHLFALTAVAAVLLALHGQQPDYWSGTDFETPRLIMTMMTAWIVFYVLLVAVAVTALAYGIVWQRMGLVFFNEPGHWLLTEIAVTGLFGMVPTIAYRWISTSLNNWDMDGFSMGVMIAAWIYSLVFVLAVPIGLNIYFGVKKCRETRWSLVFYLKAASKVLMGFGDLFVLPLVLNAAWRDRRGQFSRDSGHWCGVGLQCALSVLQIMGMIVSMTNMYLMFSRM
jgi:hypothetical protein